MLLTRVNLELKHFCPDFKPIRKLLKEMGARKIGFKKQTDYFFFLPPAKKIGYLKFRIEGKRKEMVYYDRPDFKVNKNVSADVLVYNVEDNKLLDFLKGSLGVRGMVLKRREVWRKGNCVFHLDVVKNVGKVFEIELRNPKTQKTNAKDFEIFRAYRQKVSPYLGEVIKKSNIEVVLKRK